MVLDDDRRFLENLDFSLGSDFLFYPTTRIEEAEMVLDSKPVDAIVLDYYLGVENGHDFLDRLQSRREIPPVIVVSGKVSLDMAVGFLKRKISGFLEKPIALADLKRLLTEAIAARPERREFTGDGFKVSFATRTVSMRDKVVSLTPTEFEILSYFLSKPGVQVTRQALVQHLWGANRISKNALDTHLLNLKKKLPPFAEKLVSVYGTGYCYEP